MNEDRIQTFTEEIGELKLRGARADREWGVARALHQDLDPGRTDGVRD